MNLFFHFLPKDYAKDKLFGAAVILAVLIPLAFFQWSGENYDTIKTFFWLLGLGLILWFYPRSSSQASTLVKGQPRVVKIFFILLAVFLFWAGLSTVFSIDKINSLFGFSHRFTNGLLFFLLWVSTVTFAVKIFNREKYLLIAKILVFDALLISVLGVLQSLQIAFYGTLAPAGFVRAPSLLGNPNFSSMFVAVMLPYALLFFSQSASFKAKIYYGVVGFASIWALVLFSSRGAWLAALAALTISSLAGAFYRTGKKFIIVLFLGLALGLALGKQMGDVSRPNTLTATLNFQEGNLNRRLEIWNTAVDETLKRPFWGIGLGNFQVLAEANRDSHLAEEDGIFDDPHNLFLLLSSTGGVPLLAFFCGLLIVAVVLIVHKLRSTKDALALAELGALAAFATAAAFTPVTVPLFFLLAMLLAGVIAQNLKRDLPVDAAQPGILSAWSMRAVGALVIIAGLLLFSSELFFYFGARYDWQKADEKSDKFFRFARYLNPVNQQFYFIAAAKLIDLNRPKEQVEVLINQGLSFRSKEANTYVYASNLYFGLYLKNADEQALEKAVELMQTALAIDPFFSYRYTKLGLYYYRAGKLMEAKEALKAALSFNKTDFTGWVLLAKVYQRQGRLEQERFAFKQAFLLKPDVPQVKLAWQMIKNKPINEQIILDAIFYE